MNIDEFDLTNYDTIKELSAICPEIITGCQVDYGPMLTGSPRTRSYDDILVPISVSDGTLISYEGEDLTELQIDPITGYITGFSVLRYVDNPQSILIIDDRYNIHTIGKNSFDCTKYLKEVILPNTLYRIAYNAFYCCDSIERIFIPKSIKIIDPQAFYKVPNATIFFESSRDSIYHAVGCDIFEFDNINRFNNTLYNCTREMYDECKRV